MRQHTQWTMKDSSRKVVPSEENGGYPRNIYVLGVYSGVGLAVVECLRSGDTMTISIQSIKERYRRGISA